MLLAGMAQAATAAIQTIDSAERILSASENLPADSAHWETGELPAFMQKKKVPDNAYFWYRLKVRVDQPSTGLWAIYIPRATLNVAVYVGGKLVGSSNYSGSKDEINTNYPQYFEFQSALLQQGSNTIDVRIAPSGMKENHLSLVMFGPADELIKSHYARLTIQVVGPLIVSAMDAFIGVFMLVLWSRQKHETAFGWFGFACLLWVVRNAHFFVQTPPLPYAYWYAISHGSLGWVILALYLFSFRLVGQHYPRTEIILGAYALLGTLALLLTAETRYFFIARDLNFLGLVILGATLLGYLFWFAWRMRTLIAISLALAAFFCLALGSWDFYGLIAPAAELGAHIYIMPYGSLLLTLTASAAVIDRIVQSQQKVERFNVELETRIAQRESELALSYAYTSEFEKSAAIAAERQRIVRDIHDDLGTHLMSSIPLAERGELTSKEVAAILRECIDALRLAIDSLKPLGDDLNAVLGNFRYRFAGRLAAAGLALEWDVEDLPNDPSITPEVVLQIMRIVQEAITNVIKHATASSVRVTTRFDAGRQMIFLRVADNGGGFDRTKIAQDRGEGLSSMAVRAKRIGAEFELLSSPEGTSISVMLPINQRYSLQALLANPAQLFPPGAFRGT